MKKSLLLTGLFFMVLNSGYSQSFDLGSWNILNLKYNHNEKLSVFAEGQIRSLKFYDNFHYFEYKGGITYKIQKYAHVALGAGSYQTYREGGNFVLPKNNDEFRLWPQISLNQTIGKIKAEQRARIEFRFTSNGYRNRFRYRNGISYAFGKPVNEYKPFQVSLSNEIFFTDNEPYFERNRILLALNYKPSKASTIQVGYLHQFDYKINDETGRDFFQIGYFIEFFRKSNQNKTADMDIKDN